MPKKSPKIKWPKFPRDEELILPPPSPASQKRFRKMLEAKFPAFKKLRLGKLRTINFPPKSDDAFAVFTHLSLKERKKFISAIRRYLDK